MPANKHLKYLDWLEERGQRYPTRAHSPSVMMVHSEAALSEGQIQLMCRIAAACGYQNTELEIKDFTDLANDTRVIGENEFKLVVAFGEPSAKASRQWAEGLGMSCAKVVQGPDLFKLETDPAAKRDLWLQLQPYKNLGKDI